MQSVGQIVVLLGTLLLGIFLGACLQSVVPVDTPRRLLEVVAARNPGYRGDGVKRTEAFLKDGAGEDLVEKTKTFLKDGTGFWSPFKREYYADDYVFRGPVIGPFNLEDEEKVLSTAGPHLAFPDADPGVRACWLDASVERLVYCVLYPTGTHLRDWHSPVGLIKASNHSLQSSGEVWSVLWDEQGKVKHQTVGYPINMHRGNGCGFGANFAMTCAAKGGTKATYSELVAAYVSEWTIGIPREKSSTVPSWWGDYCQGHNCP